jgi:hypothetical protein
MLEWIAANGETIAMVWAAVVAVAEVAKRLIPGTKDDTIIVKVLDVVAQVLTLGGVKLLPKQDGVLKG